MVETVPMGMNIKNPEAHELARELAAFEHTTVTNAVIISLREAVTVRRRQASAADRLARMSAQADRFAQLDAGNPGPSLAQINEGLYDDSGLPR